MSLLDGSLVLHDRWTLIVHSTIDALSLLNIVQLSHDDSLLRRLGTLFVLNSGHGAVRLHYLGKDLNVVLANYYRFNSRLAIRSRVLA